MKQFTFTLAALCATAAITTGTTAHAAPDNKFNTPPPVLKAPLLRDQLRYPLQQCHAESHDVTVLPIVAVLASNDDGTQSLSEMVDGKVVPKAPWLRAPAAGPSLLPKGNDDYILEWVRETNGVLARSGASFRLGEDIAYVAEKSTVINAGRAGDGVAMNAYFAKKRAEKSADNPYAHRMIMLFSWGGGGAEPFGGGASDIRSNFVAMPGRVDGGTKLEGKAVPGWNMMVHEMGHHLGLQHTFAGTEWILDQIGLGMTIKGVGKDGDGHKIPLWAGSPDPNGYAARSLSKEQLGYVEELLKDYSWAWDSDQFAIIDDATKQVVADGVKDTSIDLGVGLAAVKGKSPCAELTDASLGPLDGLDNLVNRTNPMSYSVCPVSGFRFSPDQVKVMEAALKRPDHALFVAHRTQVDQVCKPMEWKAGPGHVKPGEPVMRGRQPLLGERLPAIQGGVIREAGETLRR